MEIIKKLFLLSILLLILYSCDCIQHVQGYVIDSSTLQPIDSVELSRYYHKQNYYPLEVKTYTDSIGRFDYSAMTGGLFGCPKVRFYVVKSGYELYQKRYRSCCTDNDTIKLKRIE